MTKRDLTEFEKEITTNVSTHGWHSMHVFDPEDTAPGFSYSVGFPETLGAPEFIIFGLPNKLMHSMLWGLYEQISAGKMPEHGMRWSDLINGFDCVSLVADHDDLFSEYLRSANWFWKHQGREDHPPVMQLVWPSATTGLFPWEADCAEIVISAQPRLWALPVP